MPYTGTMSSVPRTRNRSYKFISHAVPRWATTAASSGTTSNSTYSVECVVANCIWKFPIIGNSEG